MVGDPPCECFNNDPISALVKPAFENAEASRVPRKRRGWHLNLIRGIRLVFMSVGIH